MSNRVLVTGGTGFIGSHIVRALAERGDSVVSFDSRPPGAEAEWLLRGHEADVAYRQGQIDQWSDVMAAFTEGDCTSVLHLAAIGDPGRLVRDPLLAHRVNVQGTLNVLEACRLTGTRRLVCFSSIGVLPGVQSEPITAAHPVLLPSEGPGSGFYGATKVFGEALCWAYRQGFGLDFAVLRPSAVYGFGMQHPIFVKPMVENAARGLPTAFEHGRDFPRDYTHVGDVADLALKALDAVPEMLSERIFYAATGEPLVTAGQVAEEVERLVPGCMIKVGEGLSDADRLEIRYRGRLSIRNAELLLGYSPRYRAIGEGLAEYLSTYRQYLSESGAI